MSVGGFEGTAPSTGSTLAKENHVQTVSILIGQRFRITFWHANRTSHRFRLFQGRNLAVGVNVPPRLQSVLVVGLLVRLRARCGSCHLRERNTMLSENHRSSLHSHNPLCLSHLLQFHLASPLIRKRLHQYHPEPPPAPQLPSPTSPLQPRAAQSLHRYPGHHLWPHSYALGPLPVCPDQQEHPYCGQLSNICVFILSPVNHRIYN